MRDTLLSRWIPELTNVTATGHSLLKSQQWSFSPTLVITADLAIIASDAAREANGGGLGGMTADGSWGRATTAEEAHMHICVLELRAAVENLKRNLVRLKNNGNSKILIACDNAAAVSWIRKGTSRDPQAREALQELFNITTANGIEVRSAHFSGVFMTLIGTDRASRVLLTSPTANL